VAIITTKKKWQGTTTYTGGVDPLLQVARDVTVPDILAADPAELYDQLQTAERQMQIWSERCDRIRRELDDVKHMTPVQKVRRRRGML
jgi:hypothetical protein